MVENQSNLGHATSTHRDVVHHGRLDPFAGSFHTEIRIWTDVDAEPLILTGAMTNTWQLEGLFLQQEYVGEADPPASAFRGKGFWGFNTTTQRYEGFWIDNASSTMQFEYGSVDDSGKVWQMHGEFVSPQTGETMQKRSQITLIDEVHHQVQVFFKAGESSEVLAMEMRYTRVQN